MNLGDEERQLGAENFFAVIGSKPLRQSLLQESLARKLASGKGLGARYFGYGAEVSPPVRIGIIGTGDEGGVLIGALNPKYVQVVAIADIRPYNIYRAFHGDKSTASALRVRPGLIKKYDWQDEETARKTVKVYTDRYEKLLDDPNVEAVIIALPLHLHAEASIKAMRKGKHVLCEKLMAHSVGECKEVARVAAQTGKLLVVGHQRHYSVLYDSAVEVIKRGLIGDIHHIRAQWHRENLPGKDSWQPLLPGPEMQARLAATTAALAEIRRELEVQKALIKKAESDNDKEKMKKLKRLVGQLDAEAKDMATSEEVLTHQLEDAQIAAKVKDYGYRDRMVGGREISALEELIRWRLWNRTGGGLMAELGSHQLDASGIFISALRSDGHKAHPLTVTAVGGRQIFEHDRDIDDHVYCSFEYPAPEYDPVKAPEKKIVVTYSSINGNGFGDYGECVLGTRGTMLLDREKQAILYRGSSTTDYVKVSVAKAPAPRSSETNLPVQKLSLVPGTSGNTDAAIASMALKEPISRGYTEEIEHWAWSIRNPGKEPLPRCGPTVALADAVIALTTNIAIARRERMVFDPAWFDPEKDETPERIPPKLDRPEYAV